MTSYLSGGRTYALDLDLVKPPSSSTSTTITSSPSSTLSDSSNSPLTILSTRKPRAPRKRPNQTYNEAAALLSTAYPNLFFTKHLPKKNLIGKTFTRQPSLIHDSSVFVDDSENLLLPFRIVESSSFFAASSAKPDSHQQSVKFGCYGDNEALESLEEDFDADSILDEEIEEVVGIDSIMGKLSVSNIDESSRDVQNQMHNDSWYENPMGLRNGVRAFRNLDGGNWWNFPIVDMLQVSPRLNTTTTNSKTKVSGSNRGDKKKKKLEKKEVAEEECPVIIPKSKFQGLLLKLNYDDVLKTWSGRDSPFPDDGPGSLDEEPARAISGKSKSRKKKLDSNSVVK
ncbi:protein CHLOROPLAST IMPORT APPARATUS 2-like [Rutidosis leptorrhynchoides]|uniref:protein CHLOROPLAST IMPORT APPARATUS 2-like n=1 Tax=Rutidosis leptorrhynchoides TaxID=125765 RepID=UPI003A99CF46